MIRIGTAGWSVPSASAAAFPGGGSHLERYARVLPCAEINSSFHRSHRVATYARWAASTPAGFRFSVKLPRSISHTARLKDVEPLLVAFTAEIVGLGDKLGVLLLQLPPSLAFDATTAMAFFDRLRELQPGPVVCEPRHASWFDAEADALLAACRVGRVAADPARVEAAGRPGGWLGERGDGGGATVYYRWHGAPRIYRSAYESDWLRQRAGEMAALSPQADCWCIFDNTASGAATGNALEMLSMRDPAGG